MLKYGAASELHAPPRVLESHQPLSSLPTSLRSYRQWILAGSLRAIEYQAKWKEDEKCFESAGRCARDIRLDEVTASTSIFDVNVLHASRRPMFLSSFNNTRENLLFASKAYVAWLACNSVSKIY